MVDVTDGDFDNADESAPQVQYRSFNIGWDRVPADSWNWWPPACDDRIRNDTAPDLWYYNNQPGYGGCSTDLDAAADACIAQARAGYVQWQGILLGQHADSVAFNAALQSAALRQGVYANWVTWDWQTGEDTISLWNFRALRKDALCAHRRPCPQAGGLRALTKPTNAKIVPRNRNQKQFLLPASAALPSAVTYVHVSSLDGRAVSLACRLSQRSVSLLTLSTSWRPLPAGRGPVFAAIISGLSACFFHFPEFCTHFYLF